MSFLGNSMFFHSAGDVLTVVSPMALQLGLVWTLGTLLAVLLLVYGSRSAKRRVSPIPLVILTLVEVAVVVIASNHTMLVFDGTHGIVQMTDKTLFFPTDEKRYVLGQVRGAVIVTYDQADALRLVLSDGTQVQMSAYNQMGGKDRAALAINRWLQAHGQPGSL